MRYQESREPEVTGKRDEAEERDIRPTHRYTVMAVLRSMAKMTTDFVHQLSLRWYLRYVMAIVS